MRPGSNFCARLGSRMRVRHAREVVVRDLKSDDAILLGRVRTNLWSSMIGPACISATRGADCEWSSAVHVTRR